jgi:hypothetical protein
MKLGKHNAFIALVSILGFVLAGTETFARSGAVAATGHAFSSPRSISHPPMARSFRNHRRGNNWPAVGGFFYGPFGDTMGDFSQAIPSDMHYTYTYDVPWDWAHKYPPAVVPSDRPYVPSCPTETVTVGGRDGSEQTINIMRCY